MTEIQNSLDIRIPEERALLFAQLYEETFPKRCEICGKSRWNF